jgi:hypothetical protein
MFRKTLLSLAASLALAVGSAAALGQVGTFVTYQGQIKNSGQVVNSLTDLRFNLYTAATGGTAVGTTFTRIGVPVTNGLFSTTFDCGVNPYISDRALWLQIDVRNPTNTGGFIPLETRQRMTGTPFSLATRGINVDGASNIGIGTPAQSNAKVIIDAGEPVFGSIRMLDAGGGAEMTFDGGNDGVAGIRHLGEEDGVFTFSALPVGDVLRLHNDGRVAIPAGKALDLGEFAPRADTNNGLIGYQLFSNGLDIVGAGPDLDNRRVTLFGETTALGFLKTDFGIGVGLRGGTPTHGVTVQSPFGFNTMRLMGPGAPFDQGAVLNFGDLDFVHISEPVDDFMELKAREGVNCVNTFSAPAKNFRIDHPSDPANMILNHGCIESDQYVNLYRGNAIIGDAGSVWIQLPAWMQDLNVDFSYQLTSVGAPQPNLYVATEVNKSNQFQVAGGTPGAKVSWIITGVRHDAYVQANPLVVEVAKPADKRGTYLSPNAFGIYTAEEMAKVGARK